MGYVLEAVIAESALLRSVAADPSSGLTGTRSAALDQGLGLVPATDEFTAADTPAADDPPGFVRLTEHLAGRITEWSKRGPVAYVEADYFGGTGSQSAVVWDGGEVALGPLHQPEGCPAPEAGSPISQALRRLGVTVGPDDLDEFDAAGLGAHRSTEGWAERATPLEEG